MQPLGFVTVTVTHDCTSTVALLTCDAVPALNFQTRPNVAPLNVGS
jgi:hypothetical protein